MLNLVVRAGATTTPHELSTGMRPSIQHLRTFVCRAFVLTPAEKRRKLSPRGEAGTFLGYEEGAKAYRVMVGTTIKISRDVVFDESRMGSDNATTDANTFEGLPNLVYDSDDEDIEAEASQQLSTLTTDATHPVVETDPPATLGSVPAADGWATLRDAAAIAGTLPLPRPESAGTTPPIPSGEAHGEPAPLQSLHEAATIAAALPPPLTNMPSHPTTLEAGGAPETSAAGGGPRRSMRVLFLPSRLGDVVPNGEAGGGAPGRTAEAATEADTGDKEISSAGDGLAACARDEADLQIGDRGSLRHQADSSAGNAYATYAGPDEDKMPLSRARRQEDWELFDTAVAKEMDALWSNGTFELGTLPRGASVLPFQILCARKRGPDGEVVRHKGRGVACGNFQVPGRDFGEVWAPVVRRATLLTVLSHAAAEGMLMYQLDVETALLNGPVDEELYVRQPKGYERGRADQVLRLRKAVYGLRQAARQWFLELVKLMDRMGMHQSAADPCLFFKDVDGARCYLLVYVDDLLLVATTPSQLKSMKDRVMAAFKSRDIGVPTYFLGLHLDRDWQEGSLVVSQRQYVQRLVKRHGLADAKPALLPMAPGAELLKAGELLEQRGIERYQALIGGLLYLATCTRTDLSYPVGRLARHASSPTEQHEAAGLRVLRYFKGTASWGLRYAGRRHLTGYCDADYAGDTATRRSTTGYAFLLNGAAVSWSSKLQATVACSTTEAEYIAAATAAREAVWLKQLLVDVGKAEGAVQMLCDSQSALHLMHNPGGTARSKHIDVAHHFVRDRVARGELRVQYVNTGEMTADALTKALPGALLTRCREGLGMAEVDTGTEQDGRGAAGHGPDAEHEQDQADRMGSDGRLVGSVGEEVPGEGGHLAGPGARRPGSSN